jgi:polyhydroxyalkanoate synthesis regulator phasin|tara:strand:+ start:225 stop:401 length:177 start_codon:yes stop_codon:yes gene_type:complete
MFNPLKMAGDMKGMEKMLKPALEKFMNDSGFIKKSELKKLEERVESLERAMLKKFSYL